MPTRTTSLVEPPPPPARRRWCNALIVIVIVIQLVVPLRYYLGGRGLDERFSWRFFSSVSLLEHDFRIDEVIDGDTPASARALPIQTLLQIGAVKKLLSTHHPDMVNAFLNWRAKQPGVREVHYHRRTSTTDGRQLPAVHRWVGTAGHPSASSPPE